MYLPMVAVLFAMIYLLRGTQERIKLPAQAIIILGSIVIVICCIGSFRQTKVWDTPDGLFEHNLAVYPESVGVRVGLGNIYRKQGRLEEAFTVLKDGLAYTDHMLLHLYVGFVYSKAGHIADAEEQFTIATTMDPLNPEPIFSLGSLYEQTGREERALPLYEQAVALDSSYVIARVKLGTLYQKAGRISEARQQFEEALQWNVNSVEAKEALRKLEEDVPSS
jgi:tetratricopeptide (TPR) repeat protein